MLYHMHMSGWNLAFRLTVKQSRRIMKRNIHVSTLIMGLWKNTRAE